MSSKKKQKQVSIEEYIKTYCQEKRIRGRYAVYISPEAHLNLRKIARLFNGKHHTTTSSLADSIISRHIETYSVLLNNAYTEDSREFMEWLKDRGFSETENEEKESESCRDNDSSQ